MDLKVDEIVQIIKTALPPEFTVTISEGSEGTTVQATTNLVVTSTLDHSTIFLNPTEMVQNTGHQMNRLIKRRLEEMLSVYFGE